MLTTSGTKRWTEGTLPREFCRSRMSVSDKRHLQGVDGRRIHGLSGELFLRFPQIVVAPDQPATPCLPRLGRNDGPKEPCHENSVGLVCPYQTNVTYKELTVGAFTAYQESYSFDFLRSSLLPINQQLHAYHVWDETMDGRNPATRIL